MEKIGFQWISDSQSIYKTTRNEKLSELLEFKQEWGHCDVPQKYANNPKLNKWVNTQRCQYRQLKSGKKSLIRDERIA